MTCALLSPRRSVVSSLVCGGVPDSCPFSFAFPAGIAEPLVSLLCVPLPAMPSAVRPLARWNALTASVVSALKRPSMWPV